MSETIERLQESIQKLRDQLEDEFRQHRESLADSLRDGRARFGAETRRLHRMQRESWRSFLSRAHFWTIVTAPVIYSLIVPFVVMHVWVWLYQAICFPAYGIPKAPMRDYIAIDRHQLAYLNGLQKLNCVYCGYCNGLIGWVREVASRTEAYWCLIKHARRLAGTHDRYVGFLDYGDAEGFPSGVQKSRMNLRQKK